MTLPEYMQAKGLKDHQAAELFGYDRSTVSKLRRGLLLPSYDQMLAIEASTDGAVTLRSWDRLRSARRDEVTG